MREFGFEMRLCARLESDGHLVSRQLGTGTRSRRIVDTVLVEPGPAFAERTRITDATIPAAAIEADVGTGRARYWRDALADYHPEYAREVVEAAVDAGFFERERRGAREYVRQTTRYPDDWFGRLLGVENKPDLSRPGDLETQLRKDVSLGLLDEVVLATATYVTGAHLNRIPEEVGVWRVDPEDGSYEVVREATPLAPEESGVEVVGESRTETHVEVVDATEKARLRRRVAERAYGKGWRVPVIDCPHVDCLELGGVGPIPYCTREERVVGPGHACDCADGTRDVDLDAFRAATSPWVRNPRGVVRRQSGLDRFR
ncbi:DUF5787 family protein [Halomarina oriensis]|uniref:Uncharacterized protein n=1 Tax=Halomarina oriensis TaxID=671145 RepID=A0A6B0GRH8_9EURY|nr:hypothetical protein [Halomarina oriensis]